MHPVPDPHPLRPGQRLALKALRGALGTLGPWVRFRRARAGLARIRPHRYGTRLAETLEVLTPATGAPRREPVVYIHGGGWIAGRKELYSPELGFLTERGHTVYNLDYPLAPEHPFPMALHSLVAALGYIAANEDVADGIHLIGDSAGGNLVMMLGLLSAEPKAFEAVDATLASARLPTVRSVVSLYGVLDRTSWIRNRFRGAQLMLHCYGGPAAFEPEVGPELALTPHDLAPARRPPCLLAIGTSDPVADSSRILHERIRDDGVRADLIEYPGERHGFFNASWRPLSKKLRADVIRFLDEV